ncbi:transcriptional regulator [Halobacteriales archaeon QS_1_68_20]|nr:MAG: transcriptional regulator [Halobacteriales archaeon QS_1_68_20]
MGRTTSEFEEEPSIPDPSEFDPGESAVDSRLELRNAFSETLTQHGFSAVTRFARERAGDVFHDRRLEILDYLRNEGPRSVRALAAELGYDKGVVSRDLQRLRRLDVVGFEEDGQAKAPRLTHRHVVIEPVV